MSPAREDHVVENAAAARHAGLVYTAHDKPGITRKLRGKHFVYFDPRGKQIKSPATLQRIAKLVIPPAYKNVWISASDRTHIQALGKDARGRTQYRYHPRWREVRDEAKYERLVAFGKAIPKIRRRVARDLRLPGLSHDKVLATIVRLLEVTLIRVGNEEYARKNHSFGLTTIHNDHVNVHGAKIHFEFRGKSGVEHAIDISDKRLANVIKQCQELPEQELFEYVDDAGKRHPITSTDVNDYLHKIAGREFTAKDFRTWAGTTLAAMALQEFEKFDSETQAKKNVVAAIEQVAKKLGNTRAVCKKCYIHPAVINTYLEGNLAATVKAQIDHDLAGKLSLLRREEVAVLALLEGRLNRDMRKRAAR